MVVSLWKTLRIWKKSQKIVKACEFLLLSLNLYSTVVQRWIFYLDEPIGDSNLHMVMKKWIQIGWSKKNEEVVSMESYQ
jgi:hypothetical protein